MLDTPKQLLTRSQSGSGDASTFRYRQRALRIYRKQLRASKKLILTLGPSTAPRWNARVFLRLLLLTNTESLLLRTLVYARGTTECLTDEQSVKYLTYYAPLVVGRDVSSHLKAENQ